MTGVSDLGLVHSAVARFLLAALVLLVLAPESTQFWKRQQGIHVVMLWTVFSLSNLLSPLRNSHSAFDLAATFISAVTVIQIRQIVGRRRVRDILTLYMTLVLLLVTTTRSVLALAAGTFNLRSLSVDSSAAGMWKGLVLISPCPTNRLSGRVAFLAFKVMLLWLMFSVDRPKIGVLLSMVVSLGLGAAILLLHRSGRTRSVVLACVTVVPFLIAPAIVVSNKLVSEYGRRTDFSGRTVLWRATVAEARNNNPVTGVGYRNALTSSAAIEADIARFGRDLGINAVHNVYLQIVAELGIFGLAALLWGLGTMFKGVLRARPISSQLRLAVDAVFIAGLCFTEPILEPSTAIFTFGCLVLAEARSMLSQSAETDSGTRVLG